MLARMDTTALVKAYASVADEVRLGGFAPPPEGEWSAEHLIAHLAVNDELLAQTTQSVLDGDPHPYYNHDAIDTARLDEIVAAHGSLAALHDWLGQTSARLIDLTSRLPENDQTLVYTHLLDGGKVRLDQSLPWVEVMKIHGNSHLINHLNQLRALRP